jgi:hypothetical protein
MDVATSENAQRSAQHDLLAGYLPDAEFCRQLRITTRTSRKWRQTGEGPPWVAVGGAIFYPADEFRKWLKRRVQTARGK